MFVVFAYFAGLLTLINPCVLPVLPIVLASALHKDRKAPIALAAGLICRSSSLAWASRPLARPLALTATWWPARRP
jgi:cytochrome c-type biogenesis protein